MCHIVNARGYGKPKYARIHLLYMMTAIDIDIHWTTKKYVREICPHTVREPMFAPALWSLQLQQGLDLRKKTGALYSRVFARASTRILIV